MDKRRLSKAGRVDVIAVIVCSVIVVVVAAVLFPMLARPGGGGGGIPITCQSNMSQIGRAFKMYLSEWHDMYPTNRPWLPDGKLGRISAHVKLSPDGKVEEDGKPERFHYGVNWVEALYPYMEAISGGYSTPPSAAWRCGAAGDRKFPEGSKTASVTYALNRNLVERPEMAVRCAADTMMVREMDRAVDAELRPTNYSCGRPDVPPNSPFLTASDSRIGNTNAKLHGNGSNVLFADGHVKGFSSRYFPRHIIAQQSWDPKEKRWFNHTSGQPVEVLRTIAITP